MSSPVSLSTSTQQFSLSSCVELIVSQFSDAIVTAIPASSPRHPLVRSMLLELSKWDNRSSCLREAAYGWCSEVCEEYSGLKDGEELLFLVLKISFRGLDVRTRWEDTGFVQPKHHQHMSDIVFNGGDAEVISDLLQAWTTHDCSQTLHKLLDAWPRHLVRIQHAVSTSQRFRRLVICSVERLGFRQVGDVRGEEFIALLDCLDVRVDDMDSDDKWLRLLFDVVRSPRGRRTLPYSYWVLMVELAVDKPLLPSGLIDRDLQVMLSLEEEGEWEKLECWIGFVWLLRGPKGDVIAEGLERVTLSLFRQRPGAVKKLEQWVRRAWINDGPECFEYLRWIRERGGLEDMSQQYTL